VTEGFFHTLVANLDCTPEDASSNPGGKGKEVRLFFNSGLFTEPRVDSTLAGVCGPIAPTSSSPGIIHRRSSSNRCPRSVEITFNQRAEGGWTLSHGCCCGRGYDVLKWVRKDCGHIAFGSRSYKW